MQKTINDSLRDQLRARYGEIGKEKQGGCGCSGSNSLCCGSARSAEDISQEMG